MSATLPVTEAPDRGFRLGRHPGLDGVRAIAIIAVMAFHAGIQRFPGGYMGVDVFFVLSGFLITALLVEERQVRGGIRLRAFYARRALRLLPALFVLLAAAAVYAAFYPHQIENQTITRDLLGTLFYVANWVQAAVHHSEIRLLSHTWSLSVEEQFYLVWPLVLVLLFKARASRLTILLVVGLGAVGSAVLRWELFQAAGQVSSPRLFQGLDTRGAGALLTGCFLGLAVGWGYVPAWLKKLATPIAVLGLAVLGYVFLGHRYDALPPAPVYREGLSLAALATAMVIFGVVMDGRSPLTRLLSLPPLVWIGRVSYGLYLWHYPIDRALRPGNLTFGLGHRSLLLLQLILTLAIVTASFYLVEQPILRQKRRFAVTPTAAGQADAGLP